MVCVRLRIESECVKIKSTFFYGRIITMNGTRAQDLLKRIMSDDDYGIAALKKATLEEAVFMVANVLPECLKKAQWENNSNDVAFFGTAISCVRNLVVKRLKDAEHLWIAYSDLTGYPYMVDKSMVVMYDYTNHQNIEKKLSDAGYRIAMGVVTADVFKNEVGHMYRNGYETVIFTNGSDVYFKVDRGELYEYEDFFTEDYITNPGVQIAMIDYFQEIRKSNKIAAMADMIERRESRMMNVLVNGEFMVPCIKEETADSIEISHPFIDLTEAVKGSDSKEQVIAVSVFTDGYEMDKCYQGHRENMLYKFEELKGLVEELGASGIVINYMGISFYMTADMIDKVVKLSEV